MFSIFLESPTPRRFDGCESLLAANWANHKGPGIVRRAVGGRRQASGQSVTNSWVFALNRCARRGLRAAPRGGRAAAARRSAMAPQRVECDAQDNHEFLEGHRDDI